MFVDQSSVVLSAGNGGDGCLSFHRARYVPKGGPDGGDGGKGGDVILECDENVGDLSAFRFKRQWKAEHGRSGEGGRRHGRSGRDCLLKLPPGTSVFREETGQLVAELLEHGQKVCLLEGGRGGLGNVHFKSSVNQAPRKTTPGREGSTGRFLLVLKTIADIGLVGFPNAGKSTLLNALTKARPKIGAYAFTTLHPMVGIWSGEDDLVRMKVADIPGLIEGSGENRGLGHRFLRHIERCPALLHVVDISGAEGRDPVQDFKVLRQELEAFGRGLASKPFLVAANKMDEAGSSDHLALFEKTTGIRAYPISALLEEGLDALIEGMLSLVSSLKDGATTKK